MKCQENAYQTELPDFFESEDTVMKSQKKPVLNKKKLRSTSKDSHLKLSKNKKKIKYSHKPK